MWQSLVAVDSISKCFFFQYCISTMMIRQKSVSNVSMKVGYSDAYIFLSIEINVIALKSPGSQLHVDSFKFSRSCCFMSIPVCTVTE